MCFVQSLSVKPSHRKSPVEGHHINPMNILHIRGYYYAIAKTAKVIGLIVKELSQL